MKKILCLIDSLHAGGAQRQLVGLAKLLKEEGCNVVVACYYVDNCFYEDWLIENSINLIKLNVRNKRILKILEIKKIINRGEYDKVIAYLDGPAIIACILKLFCCKFRLIVSERNTTQKLTIKDRFKFHLYRIADVIVPNSITQTNFMKIKFPFLKKKIYTITNFVDTDYFSPNSNNGVNELLKILVVGRINKQKNVLTFIKAMSIMKKRNIKFEVNWFGYYDNEGYFFKCKELIEENSLDELKFHNPKKNIIKEYQENDVFCLPSIFEGYPNVVCEAMSCGLPVICSNVCDNPYIVDENKTGFLFNPNDVDSIVGALVKFNSLTSSERERMKQECRNVAISKFSKETFVKKYMSLLR